MIVKQFYLGCLSHASYLIADEETATAVVVDPQRDVQQYLAEAEKRGLTIRHVFLTHFHADFLAGHLELRDRTGARIHLGAKAEAEYDFEPMAEGDALELGKVRLEVLETPGHTPEGISILVFDLEQGRDRPYAVLTGDTLFIGDVGRPDLMASVGMTADELARSLYRSLREKLLPLPDETLVYPAHGAGSMCGKNLSTDTFSTMGVQREHNYALQPMAEDEFVGMVTAELPAAPKYFGYDAVLNRQERPTLEAALELEALDLNAVLRLESESAQLVDVREAADFAAEHLRGTLNVGLGGRFASWCGTLLDPERPIALIAPPGREAEAALRLGRIGFDNIAGYLDGGPSAWRTRPDVVRRSERLTPATLARELAAAPAPVTIDVRSPRECQTARIQGSLNLPLGELERRIDEVPRGSRLVLYCESGYRSSSAASLLRQHGLTEIADLEGGMEAWRAADLETAAEGQPT